MLRSSGLISVLALSAAAFAHASAQTPPIDSGKVDSENEACPRGGLSVYYARGEATPSEQAGLLIARISEEASRCRPDAIDVVTEIDTDGDGGAAIALALARLNNVAEALVAGGVPADRIRIAAQANAETRPSMGEITVYFRKSAKDAGEASAPAAPKRTMPIPGAI